MEPDRTQRDAIDKPSVLVVGAGPTGLMLAGELALAGVRCRILKRRGEESNLTRAFGVHARTLEILDMRGMADELLSAGRAALRDWCGSACTYTTAERSHTV